ncbi:MAG TPA: CdaR family protein [Vicinamibacteria bacterium]|jgi:YbbR domain-containing protein
MRFTVLDNLPLKLVSLVLAVLLWFVIAGEKTSEMGLSAPVELQNFPKDLELTGDPVDTVEVRLRASPGIIQRLTPGDVSAHIDLADAHEGERIVHLTPDSVRVPFGVTVVKISPSIITLNLERTLQKTVPVRPRLLGRPAPGYEVGEMTTEPAEVRIAGPKSRVQEVESAYTEPVSVEGAEANVVDNVNIGLEDPLLRIQGNPRVRVTARIREVEHTRTLAGLPVEVRRGSFTARPPRVTVVLAGPASVLDQADGAAVHPYVDAGQVDETGTAHVAVELAPGLTGVEVRETQPAEVALRPLRPARKKS